MSKGTSPNQIKCVVVGDGSVGKTCLLWVFQKDQFPSEYVPTVFTNTVMSNMNYEDKIVNLALYDTAGQEEYDRLRSLSYPGTNVFLICFSKVNKGTFENVIYKWNAEVKHHCPLAKIVLVGTKLDLLDENEQKEDIVTYEQAMEMKEKIGAFSYIECSAKNKTRVKEVFQEVIKASFSVVSVGNKNEKNKKCIIL